MTARIIKNVCFILFIGVFFSGKSQTKIDNFSEWKFKTGDEKAWQKPGFDDSGWETIDVNLGWDNQGYLAYDGVAYYRSTIIIPSSLRKDALIEGLWFYLGMIDDCDSTFLNGKFIGSMEFWRMERNYFVSLTNDCIMWDKPNTIAVKVLDTGGGGGMHFGKPYIKTSLPLDFVSFNLDGDFIISQQGNIQREIEIKSCSKNTINGTINSYVIDLLKEDTVYSDNKDISLTPGSTYRYFLNFNLDFNNSCRVIYAYNLASANNTKTVSEEIPYILTPKASLSPSVNGPTITGVRPGSPFLYKVPVTGERPLDITVSNLPKGICFDPKTAILSGKITVPGNYELKIHAQNEKGNDSKILTIKVGDTIALTPPMGWNSWNCWGLLIDEQKVKAAADAFVSSGLADYGWAYINIDDGWEAPERDYNGVLKTNDKFKDIKGLADYVHSMGLKIGIYSSPGPYTCGRYLGSYQYEKTDIETWADWGIDFLKYDWCGYSSIVPNPNRDELIAPYKLASEIIKKQPRDIVFSLCQYGMGNVWEWGGEAGGNLWRTTGDIEDTWESMSGIGFGQFDKAQYAKPGNWNDPDMLVVGKLGWGNVRNNRLTPDEQYTHISLWCLLKSPLLIGCDLSRLDSFTMNLLCNSEVLAINQDALGKQAERIYNENNIQVFMVQLADGGYAMGIFNLNGQTTSFDLKPELLKLTGTYVLRDVWKQQDEGSLNELHTIKIAPHGTKLYKLSKKKFM